MGTSWRRREKPCCYAKLQQLALDLIPRLQEIERSWGGRFP
jgi:hypothetical protein